MLTHDNDYLPQVTKLTPNDAVLSFNDSQTRQMMLDYLKYRLDPILRQAAGTKEEASRALDGVLNEFLDEVALDFQGQQVHIHIGPD